MIVVVDYGMGNLRSVQKGFEKVGGEASIVSSPEELLKADKVVLPGVGAFRDAKEGLEQKGLIGPILQHVSRGKPFLGICLGLQLLFSMSTEGGEHKGLDVIRGKVVRFEDNALKIPHMGWNQVHFKKDCPITKGIPQNSYMYFVHSYYVVPEDALVVAAETDYGINFTSMIWKDNLFATQFHPEKSHDCGLMILRNFVKL